MGITANFTESDVRDRLDAFLDVVQKQQVKRLMRIGEMCIQYARDTHPNDWQDQTGNLRSSIGYMVFEDGVAIHNSPFEQVSAQTGVNGDVLDGGQKGMALCKRIGEQTTGVSLVCVAGMEYAVYVESNGRDVLTGAEHLAERELPKQLAALIDNINKATE